MSSPKARAHTYRSKSLIRSQRWRWDLVTANGRLVAHSGEGYANATHACEMMYRVSVGGYADHPTDVYRTRSLERSQRWAWRLVVDGRKVAVSGEGYTDRSEAERMASRVLSGIYAVEFVS